MSRVAGESPTEPIVSWLLAHQRREDVHRCLMLPWGRRRLALCARCAALYPTMVVSLLGLLFLKVGPLGFLDHLWVLLMSAPAYFDWGASRLGAPGSTPARIFTGMFLGVALGRSFSLYLPDPWSEVFWVHSLVSLAVVVAVEIVRALDLGDF